MTEILVAMGVPSAITGLIVWWFKRYVDKKDRDTAEREAKRHAISEEREKNYEKIMLMIMQTSRASYVLAEATAKAVQRIPDAKCNGDMTEALKQAEKIQKEEQQFLINAGIKHIFGTDGE